MFFFPQILGKQCPWEVGLNGNSSVFLPFLLFSPAGTKKAKAAHACLLVKTESVKSKMRALPPLDHKKIKQVATFSCKSRGPGSLGGDTLLQEFQVILFWPRALKERDLILKGKYLTGSDSALRYQG